jgi:hypothetical protein
MSGCCQENGMKDQCCRSESPNQSDASDVAVAESAREGHDCAGHQREEVTTHS